jgi:hypothetical protein
MRRHEIAAEELFQSSHLRLYFPEIFIFLACFIAALPDRITAAE